MGIADGAQGGRPVAPVLLIKSGNQPLSHCRERESGDLLIPNWSLSVECVAGLHVPLIKGIHFVHPGQRSNCAPWFEKLEISSYLKPQVAITHETFQLAVKLTNIV